MEFGFKQACLVYRVDSSAEVKDELIRLLRRMEEKINNDDQHTDEHVRYAQCSLGTVSRTTNFKYI